MQFHRLVIIQRGFCAICGLPGIEEIDHIDGNPSNNNAVNLRGVHKACNVAEGNKKRKGYTYNSSVLMRKREREIDQTIEPTRPTSWESSRSLELRPTLELECRRLLMESGKQLDGSFWTPTVRNMEDRLSKILDCDQEVVTKFVNRELQPEGFLAISERTVEGRKKRTAQILSIKKPPNAEVQAKLDEIERADKEQRVSSSIFLNKNGHQCPECRRMGGRHTLTCSRFKGRKEHLEIGAPTF